MQGPVLQSFSYDEADPYAAGQHRGIDIGAGAAGEPVVAPAAGTVSFAGTVPTNGKSVTIQTADGYSVTLTHLGAILVAKGSAIAERDSVGTVGPSGTTEVDGPYVHLGVRHTADPNGYLDPLTLLPPQTQTGPTDDGTTVSQPSSTSSATTTTTSDPAPAVSASTAASGAHGSTVHRQRGHGSRRQNTRTRMSRTKTQEQRSKQRPASRPASAGQHEEHDARVPHRRASEPASPSQRPGVGTVAHRPTDLDAGHQIRPSAQHPAPQMPDVLVPLICNGAAAVVALAAAFAAAYRRRRAAPGEGEGARVLHLPERRALRRAA